MAYNSSFGSSPFSSMLTRWVRRLLLANVALFVLALVLRWTTGIQAASYLAFRPGDFLTSPWTLLTYMFVHGDLFHLLFNMLGLFFFGPVLEDRWGSREFIKFYLMCGLAGAVLSALFMLLDPFAAIIGASAAVYGIMVAFAMYWPDSPIYIWGVFPVKAKWLVGFLVGMSLVFSLGGGRSGTADLAHLGGAIAAFGYLKSPWAPSAFGEVYSSTRATRTRRKRGWRDLLPGRRRRHVAVHEPPPAPRPAAKPQPGRGDDDVDRILDKISAGGIESLTPEERRKLEEASRRLGTN
jgi:membrane associated rhomboid family serine protease